MQTISRAEAKKAVALITRDAMLISSALLLSYVESFVPVNLIIPLPGFKFGLANIVVMFAFFAFSAADAVFVSAARVIIAALLFGSPVSFLFSMAGAFLSLLGMFIIKCTVKKAFSFWGISVISAALHNAGQLAAASALFGSAVLSYFPALLLASAVFGSVSGIILNLLWPRLKPVCGRMVK
jgi:heptaprenyl diphosphate synthase